MAKAGRRARARALAMARAAAQRRQQQQAAAEAAHGTSTIEKLPADILGVLFGCLGFHAFTIHRWSFHYYDWKRIFEWQRKLSGDEYDFQQKRWIPGPRPHTVNDVIEFLQEDWAERCDYVGYGRGPEGGH